jgi:hypothetical protein
MIMRNEVKEGYCLEHTKLKVRINERFSVHGVHLG